MALRKLVSKLRLGRRGGKRRRDTGSQVHMNATMIVMAYPVIENVLEMPLSQRNEEIQTLPADRSRPDVRKPNLLGALAAASAAPARPWRPRSDPIAGRRFCPGHG